MAYAYWKSLKTTDRAVFDLFFRKNPFEGEFTIFAGLEECLKFLEKFAYSESGNHATKTLRVYYVYAFLDIQYLKVALPDNVEDYFFDYLRSMTAKDVTIYALPEGSVCFPRIPLLRVEGPLIVVQLLETTFLTLINYARCDCNFKCFILSFNDCFN